MRRTREALGAEGASVVVADLNVESGEQVAGIGPTCGRAVRPHRRLVARVRGGAGRGRPSRRTAGSTGWSTTPRSTARWQFDLLISVDWDYYKKFMSVNMDGALVMTRAVYPEIQKRGGGSIVNQLDRGVPLLRLLRPGQGRRQRPDPPARPRARRPEDPGQRDRPRPDRHRGHAHPGRRRRQGPGQGPRAQADGPARGHGRRLPLPALRRVVVGDRPDHRRRRRTDVPRMTDDQGRLHRARQHRQADGAAARVVRRHRAVRSTTSRRDPVAELEAAGAERRRQRRGTRRTVDVICVMVRDDDQVRDVLGEILGVARRRRRPSSSTRPSRPARPRRSRTPRPGTA